MLRLDRSGCKDIAKEIFINVILPYKSLVQIIRHKYLLKNVYRYSLKSIYSNYNFLYLKVSKLKMMH